MDSETIWRKSTKSFDRMRFPCLIVDATTHNHHSHPHHRGDAIYRRISFQVARQFVIVREFTALRSTSEYLKELILDTIPQDIVIITNTLANTVPSTNISTTDGRYKSGQWQ